MFRNYLIIALRNLYRNKFFSLINILGLAIGMAAVLLIAEYLAHELSYDQFHERKGNVYRLVVKHESADNSQFTEYLTAAVGESMLREFPEVVSMARFSNLQSAYFSYKGQNYYEDKVTYADSSIFGIFSFKLLKGDARYCLTEPGSVVLTTRSAQKIFGKKEEPLGKMITFNGEKTLKVTGIVEDPPLNSSLQFDALVSFSSLYQNPDLRLDWDGGWNYPTFVLLAEGSTPENIQDRFEDFMERHINYKYRRHGFLLSLYMQPLEEIHLYSGQDYGLEGEGRLTNLYVFASIAFFILLIACFNFMNLSTARSVRRAKEIGIRKVSGAHRRSIIRQFLLESVVTSFLALLIALVLVEAIQPLFNDLTGRELNLFGQSGYLIISIFILLIIITGILAGSYPAFFMSRFQAIRIIKGNFESRRGKPVFRNILVLVQFMISAFLIFSTLVIQSQIRYLREKPLGFDREQVYVVPLTTEKARKGYEAFRQRLSSIPSIVASGASTGIPGNGLTSNGYLPEGRKDPMMIHVIEVDDHYLDLMGIPEIRGESFSPDGSLDSNKILINECLARELGWEKPIGKSIYRGGEFTVIGVVQDFHFAPLSESIEPLVITQLPWNGFYNLSIKVNTRNPKETMDQVEQAWNEVFPEESFEYFSLERYIDDAYREISGLRSIFIYFTLLAIIVACMGLLGLASFTTGQKSREVGIRKVFGAGNTGITIKLASDFMRWVLLANVIAIPFAWWAMDHWLTNFAYRAGIGGRAVVLTLLITLGLSFLTVIFQALQLARTNPADTLKYE